MYFKAALTDAEMPSLSIWRHARLDLKGSVEGFRLFDFSNTLAFSSIAKSLSRCQGQAKHTLQIHNKVNSADTKKNELLNLYDFQACNIRI